MNKLLVVVFCLFAFSGHFQARGMEWDAEENRRHFDGVGHSHPTHFLGDNLSENIFEFDPRNNAEFNNIGWQDGQFIIREREVAEHMIMFLGASRCYVDSEPVISPANGGKIGLHTKPRGGGRYGRSETDPQLFCGRIAGVFEIEGYKGIASAFPNSNGGVDDGYIGPHLRPANFAGDFDRRIGSRSGTDSGFGRFAGIPESNNEKANSEYASYNLPKSQGDQYVGRPGHPLLRPQVFFLTLLGFLAIFVTSWWGGPLALDGRTWPRRLIGLGATSLGLFVGAGFWAWAVYGYPLAVIYQWGPFWRVFSRVLLGA